MLEPLSAILPALRKAAEDLREDGDTRLGNKIIFTTRPKPDTQRPYGLLSLIDEPRAPLHGTTEATLQLSYWASLWQVEQFAEAVDWLDGHRTETENMKGGRYARLSRSVTEDPDLENVYMLSDTVRCQYLSVQRLGAIPP